MQEARLQTEVRALIEMYKPHTWRELLGEIISNPSEKQRIAEELGINPITLNRWANNESTPRAQNLRRLLQAVPRHQQTLHALMNNEFGDLSIADLADLAEEIPSTFYVRVFKTRAATIEALRFWTIGNLILDQALGQLDQSHAGIAITVARCMPPWKGNKVRSLRESIGKGTPPWTGDLEQKAMFLGAETLAGYAAATCHPVICQNLKEDHPLIPAHQVEGEMSAAIYPILYVGRLAGCLVVHCIQPNYFLAQERLTLIQQYADLMALAFEPDEFYDPGDIQLYIMPSHEVQKHYFANFRVRAANAMRRAASQGEALSNIEAEQLVWQQLEEELIQVSAGAFA